MPEPVHRSLPLQPHAVIGREQAIETAQAFLLCPDCRLLTVLGLGGVGKTRLALAVAEAVADHFRDGICFVDLTQITDPAVVPALLAAQLGLRTDARPAVERLTAYLRNRQILLVLDNVEHVMAGTGVVSQLLAAADGLTVLATSREPLRLRWEQRLLLDPLEVPDLDHLPSSEELRQVPSVALFLQRAYALNLHFPVDDETLSSIAALCVWLEGIPLAIELAAAKTTILSPTAILARLTTHPSLLRQRAPDVPDRHDSLQASLVWSYDLLSAPEQALFRRLGVFVGGCTLEALRAVVTEPHEDSEALDVLSSLIDKGLLPPVPLREGEVRYRLLETVRVFASEHLQAAGELEQVQAAHARWYCSLVEHETGNLRIAGFLIFSPEHTCASTPLHDLWSVRLDGDRANLEAALRWSEQHDAATFLRLAVGLARYWWVKGWLPEGARWLEQALDQCPDNARVLRARLLGKLGALYRQQGDSARARVHLEEAVALSRTLAEPQILLAHLINLGSAFVSEGHVPDGIALFDEAFLRAQSAGDAWGRAAALAYLGFGELVRRREREAEDYLQQSLPLFHQLGDHRSVLFIKAVLGRTIWQQEDVKRALQTVEESLRLCRELGQETVMPVVLEMTACVLSQVVAPEDCARLLGAGDALRERGYARSGPEHGYYEQTLATLRALLDAETLAAALAQGRQRAGVGAITEALALVEQALASPDEAAVTRRVRSTAALSRREEEVLALLAQGYSNREIAVQLGISENTAKFHVTAILNKLGVKGRAQAVSRAIKDGLIDR